MEELAPGTIAAAAGLLGGIVLGFSARWGRFCTLGAIEDAVLGGNTNRLRAWGLAIAVAIFGTYGLDHAGLINISESFYISSPTTLLASIFGGVIFGLGMAFVGTCGFGTLARLGGGDLKSLVTFLIMGISAYATLRGLTAYIRVALFPAPNQREIPASFATLLNSSFGFSTSISAYVIAGVLTIICLTSSKFRSDSKRIIVGILVGLSIVWGWYATGVLATNDFEPYPLENFTFSAPLGETIVYAMTASGSALKFGIGATVGVVFGAFITSLFLGHFRWESSEDPKEMKRQVLGGFLMGAGSVTALGCTIGQGISAFSTLAYSAPVVLSSIFVGAWLGLQYLVHGSFKEPLMHLFSRQQT